MRTETIEIYTFNELPGDTQQKVIENLWDINVDYEWWDQVYEDAENVGIKITGFDIGRGSCCEGDFIEYAVDIAKQIIMNHGPNCETHKTAKEYIDALIEEWEGDYDGEPIAKEFKQSIMEDYRIMLSKEYDYLTGKEAIIETIVSNGYEFTKDGSLY